MRRIQGLRNEDLERLLVKTETVKLPVKSQIDKSLHKLKLFNSKLPC